MENNRKHIDDLFKKGLGGYTETPPPAVWDALEKRLDDNGNRKLYPWLWFALIGFVAISSGVLLALRETVPKVVVENAKKIIILNKQEVAITGSRKTEPVALIYNSVKNLKRDKKVTKHNRVINDQEEFNNTSDKPGNTAISKDNNPGNAITTDNSPASVLITSETTSKGNIHIEQQVIKVQGNKDEEKNTALLASNTNDLGSITSVKKHGIVVETLPAESVTSDNAIAANHWQSPATLAAQPQPELATQPTATIAKAHKKQVKPQAQKAVAVNEKIVAHTQLRNKSNKKEPAQNAIVAKEAVKSEVKNAVSASLHKSLPKQTHKANTLVANKKKPTTAAKKAIGDNNNAKVAANKEKKITSTQPNKPETKKVIAKNNPSQHTQTQVLAPQQKPVNTYSSSAPVQTATLKTAIQSNNSVAVNKNEDTKLPGTFKESLVKPAITDSSKGGSGGTDTSAAKKLRRFEFGVKAGYEGGFNNGAAKKLLVSPYIQYNITSRLSVMSQPAIKSTQVSGMRLSGNQSFYSINPGGTTKLVDSNVVLVISGGSVVDTFIRRSYNYSQTYDSIAKTYRYGGSYIEFEIPLLLKYGLTKTLSVYGGITMTYSKLVSITENTYTSAPITKAGSGYTIAPYYQQAPAPPPISSAITYTGTSISGYKGPLYPSPQGDLFRLGYMLGVSYEVHKRFLLDVSVQQSGVSTNLQGGYDTNKPLSSVYYRFTVGYRLAK